MYVPLSPACRALALRTARPRLSPSHAVEEPPCCGWYGHFGGVPVALKLWWFGKRSPVCIGNPPP